MTNKIIEHHGRPLSLYKANIAPDLQSYTVLVSDSWDYVEMYLKRFQKSKAIFFWNQARTFYNAYQVLPKGCKALLGYYCILNATKAFLEAKGRRYQDMHGVTGAKINRKAVLANERVIYCSAGILGSLCDYLNEPVNRDTYSLKDMLYNLPFCHRAYNLTFTSQKELFVPIENPRFMYNDLNNEAWFAFGLQRKNQDVKTHREIGSGWERDPTISDECVVRKKKRFKLDSNLTKFVAYHQEIRKVVSYIYSPNKLWYLKKRICSKSIIERSTMTLIFGAMHRVSELERYAPDILERHFESKHNWLLAEFLMTAVPQFIDEISCELTGQNFYVPGKRIP